MTADSKRLMHISRAVGNETFSDKGFYCNLSVSDFLSRPSFVGWQTVDHYVNAVPNQYDYLIVCAECVANITPLEALALMDL